MNQSKQQNLTSNHSQKKNKKNKLQCKFKQNTKALTTIEDFSDELFIQIFDYLDGCDIYNGFSYINNRFKQLINSSFILFKLNLDKYLSNKILINIYKKLINNNKNQIISINCSTTNSINLLYSTISFNSSFNQLQSLILYDFKSNKFISLLNNLSYLPCLYSLTLKIFQNSTNLSDIYQIIFKFSKLKYLNILSNHSNLPLTLSINTNQQYNSFTHFTIENHCNFNNILKILSYTPKLNYLKYTNKNSIDNNIEINSPIKLLNLKTFIICVYNTKFNIFQIFLQQIDANIKILSFTSHYEDINYLDSNCWKKLIENNLSQLKKFYLYYYEKYSSQIQLYQGQSNQFNTSFWIKRKWIFEIERYFQYIIYSIRPYKERWDDFLPNKDNYLSKRIQLTFRDLNPNEWRNIINNNIKHFLSLTQIYHLIIPIEKIFIGILIPIINSLPKLISLKLHSLSFSDPENMNHDDYNILFSIESKNKIINVYLEKMNNIQEIYFLRTLCPHMIYLKVDWIQGQRNMIPYQHVHFE